MSNLGIIEAINRQNAQTHQHLKNIKKSVNGDYTSTTLEGTTNLNIYSGVSDGIDMEGYNHLSIIVHCSGMTGGISPVQNLKLYYSLDNATYALGEVITTNEVPGSAGTYSGHIRVENTGFRYVKLFAVGVSGMLPGSVYTIHFCRR